MSSVSTLTERLKTEARRLGFDAVGIAPAVPPPGHAHFLDWLTNRFSAGMNYLERGAVARSHPRHILDGVRSVVVGMIVYGGSESPLPGSLEGKVARYAHAPDYHEVLWRRLEALLSWLQTERPEIKGRAVADTAPLLERDFAQLAGLGWIGKNTMLIDRRLGSYTVIGSLLVDAELEYDQPHEANHCGTCTRCLEACPTDAFPAPYQLDARRCISYWTIEHRGAIDDAMADQLHGWAFGCDICQEVCPWNRKAPDAASAALQPNPEWTHADLMRWLTFDAEEFTAFLKGSALKRAKRSGLMRNAALLLGQRKVAEAIPALKARMSDADPVVRDACVWALRRIGTPDALEPLDVAAKDRDPAEVFPSTGSGLKPK
jgi:epoxyqueuosine reductase